MTDEEIENQLITEEIIIRGSEFIQHPDMIGIEIEAAYRIVMELRKRNLLRVTVNLDGEEPLIFWELKCSEDT